MPDARIPLKNRPLAGILAFLVPGAGHLYQGRMFKAAIYFVCIVGLFLTGMVMADWKAVQPPGDVRLGPFQVYDDGRAPAAGNGLRTLKFAAQASLGVPALVSLVQNQRLKNSSEQPVRELSQPQPLTAAFTGTMSRFTETALEELRVTGNLKLEKVAGSFGGEAIGGRLQGTADAQSVDVKLGGFVELGPAMGSEALRPVHAALYDDAGEREIGRLEGGIPRSITNHFMVRMTEDEENSLQRKLGKRHELAMVLTWIAGLLNILAIWDAVEGPAYGYDDEEEKTDQAAKTPAA